MWCDNFWLSNLSQVIVDALSSDLQYTYGVILPLCKQHLLIFKHKTHFSNIYSYTNIKARTVLSHCGIINVGTQPLTLENNNITLVVCGRLWNKTNSHYSIQTDQTCNTHALVESKPLLLRYTKLMILQSHYIYPTFEPGPSLPHHPHSHPQLQQQLQVTLWNKNQIMHGNRRCFIFQDIWLPMTTKTSQMKRNGRLLAFPSGF